VPNFDPAQELPEDSTVQTVPVGLPNQFGGFQVGPASNPDISPRPVPGDVVVDSSRIVDPALRAAYVAAHPPYVPAAPMPPAPANDNTLPVASAPQNAPEGAPASAPTTKRGIGAGGGAGLPPNADDLEKEIDQGTKDQADAQGRLRDEQTAEADRLKEAYEAKDDLRRQQAADLAAEQLFVRERQQALDAEDAENLKVARDKVIPDFWAGREGALAGAAITVGLSGAAGALLGTTQNTALQAIQHNVDSYYSREIDKVNNLYRYAEAKGKLNDNIRNELHGQVTDLIQQHAYTLESAADRIEAIKQESGARINAATTDATIAGLRGQAAKEKLQVRGLDVQRYNAQTSRISANAEAARVGIERQKAQQDQGEKADEAAFRTYVQGPHGKQAQETTRRLDALDSAYEGVDQARSVGEVTAQIDKAIAADAGQGTRGVSMGQLHTILPNLVSASGEISNKVSQNWDGSAGKDFRAAAKRLIQTARDNRGAQYDREGSDLEKNLALTPHGQKSKDFARNSRLQLYPERASAAPAPTPATRTLKMPDGSLATFDASGKRIK
jgi:hypothetical protein